MYLLTLHDKRTLLRHPAAASTDPLVLEGACDDLRTDPTVGRYLESHLLVPAVHPVPAPTAPVVDTRDDAREVVVSRILGLVRSF